MKKIAGVVLLILGLYMIYLSFPASGGVMRPPMVSGIAFLVIGGVFLNPKA